MNLKQIELYGFKSFADRQIIKFESGFTGIVGPNGSGKSNVVDAVRWCLGEQSTKNIRGKTMQNMIFGGTENRKSMSYAEVSLYFDNTDRSFNSDIDEIVITRKLYRSGDSEYYINRETCRLRDVIDFFRDTGVGREGYSIVGQNKISEIMRAKPEDLRVLFEEAAGISKMKFSKRDAEKKLEDTNINLDRLNDKLTILGDDLPTLEKKAENALKARTVRAVLKEQEINSYVYQREHNEEEKEKLIGKITALNEDLIREGKALDKLNEEERAGEVESLGLDAEYDRAYSSYTDASLAKLKGENQRQKLKDSLAVSETSISKLQYEIKNAESEISKITDIIEGQEKEKNGLHAQLVEAAKKDNETKILYADADKLVKRKTEELSDANDFIMQHISKQGKIGANVYALETAISLLNRQLEEYENRLDINKSHLSSVEKNLKTLVENYYSLVADRDKKKVVWKKQRAEHLEVMTELDDYRGKSSELSKEEASLLSKIQMLESLKKNYEGFGFAVKTIMNSDNDEIRSYALGVVGEIVTVSKQYQTAISTALGGAITNIVTRNTYETGILINYLKRTNGGNGTFLPLETIKEHRLSRDCERVLDEEGCCGLAKDLIRYDRFYAPIFNSLLGAIVVFDNYDNAAAALKKYGGAFRIVTLDGENLTTMGSISGGSKTTQNSEAILSRDVDLKENTKRYKTVQNELAVLKDEIYDAETRMKQLENSNAVLDTQIAKLERDIGVEEQKKSNLEDEKSRLLTEFNENDNLVSHCKSELKQKKEESERESNALSTENVKTISANDVKSKLEAELVNARKTYETLQQAVGETTAQLIIIQQKLETINKAIAENRASIPLLREKFYQYDSELKVTKSNYDATKAELDSYQEEAFDSQEVENAKKRIDSIGTRRNEIREKLENIRKSKMKQLNVINDVKEKNQRNQYNLERIDSNMATLAEDILHKYSLEYEEAKEYRVDGYDIDAGREEIRRLERELNKIGAVDDASVEEYAEKKKTFDSESEHYEEMCRARDDIMSTISEMETEMIGKFNVSFEAISKNFEDIFVDLFGQGARAKLETEVEKGQTILDGGVRIYAVPPGKKLMEMSLLSGGEQALTAISLLFAIIKLKPMPFCILDETESALDEVNAESYAKYLKKYSTNTQFIVITHRKPTMQHAGMLYGITMQEKGISVVIPVQLEEAVASIKKKS